MPDTYERAVCELAAVISHNQGVMDHSRTVAAVRDFAAVVTAHAVTEARRACPPITVNVVLPHGLTEQLARIEHALGTIHSTEARLMSKFDDVLAQVTALENKNDGIIAALNGVAQEVRDLRTQVGSGTPVTEAQLADLETRLTTDGQKVVDAINANTDVLPVAPPAPPVEPAPPTG